MIKQIKNENENENRNGQTQCIVYIISQSIPKSIDILKNYFYFWY